MRGLADVDLAHWRATGWVLQPGALDPAAITELTGWVDEVAAWAETDRAPGLHHWEQTDRGPALARSEDLVPHHAGLRSLICDELVHTAGALFGEPAVLFKEKVNYKQPGGAGFAPHQDATAYRFVDHHVSCMVSIDPATTASGCLYVASGHHHGHLPTDERGRIAGAVAAGLPWEAVEVAPGDLLWFDSYTPHHSGPNTTDRPRRAIYLTYNARSAGDLRAEYYADKTAELAASDGTFGGERVRISISDDFLGRPVEGRP